MVLKGRPADMELFSLYASGLQTGLKSSHTLIRQLQTTKKLRSIPHFSTLRLRPTYRQDVENTLQSAQAARANGQKVVQLQIH